MVGVSIAVSALRNRSGVLGFGHPGPRKGEKSNGVAGNVAVNPASH